MGKNYVYTVGRFNVPHNGHIRYFLNLLNIYEKLIIGIGSCYTANHFRHPVLAFLREKMIYKSLLNAGVNMSRVIFVHIPDFDSWEEWWLHVISIPQIDKVITFATGNEEEITNEIKKRNLKLPFEIFNPEKDVPEEKRYPYRATDLRNSILENNYQLFSEIAASEPLN